MIWKHSRYLRSREFHEFLDSKNIFGAHGSRAHVEYVATTFNFDDFRRLIAIWGLACAARASTRATKKSNECKLCSKISLKFLWFAHSSKSEVFRATWGFMIFFWKFDFCSKKSKKLQISSKICYFWAKIEFSKKSWNFI